MIFGSKGLVFLFNASKKQRVPFVSLRVLSSVSGSSSSATVLLPQCLGELFARPPRLNSDVTVQGWIKAVRVQKNIAFMDISDGTTYQNLMCVIPPELASNLKTGESIQIRGLWCESKGGKQKYELKIPKDYKISDEFDNCIKVIGTVPENYPLQKKFHTQQFLRTIPHLRWKTNVLSSILRFRSHVETSLIAFFNEKNFIKTNPPLITSSDCEGAGELFKIESTSNEKNPTEKFFGKDSYLTVSTQLHLEVLCMALSRVWTLSPCFRAEESSTNRHLSEFWMLEAEIAFINDVRQLTKFSELMIKHVVRTLLDDSSEIGKNLIESRRGRAVEEAIKIREKWNFLLSKDEWDCITYTEAIDILQKAEADGIVKFKFKPTWGASLQSEHEKWLAGEYFKSPVSVTDYPIELKPFYMKINNDKKTVACFDLLVPEIGELVGGSIREHDLFKLSNEMTRRNMKVDDLNWYIDLRSNGSVPHGGFGMGFERLLCYLGNIENIRDVIPFPRSAETLDC
ncbi:hypothetical protein PACTADRAFT_49521 [Pachysolen tannophilus NRRL Y-2460]|uniref:Asparagine--tRNA ligase, mitochondrial n=1 Tax=Pachysolen tannophilus NRRL Y-2460 TaxID=669874 RepID=A0A1E4TWK9_PACTA|nr:hypothetical protein PACTADRAFT_49521 [Pachysolen tannophilus NRRL Y-2460]